MVVVARMKFLFQRQDVLLVDVAKHEADMRFFGLKVLQGEQGIDGQQRRSQVLFLVSMPSRSTATVHVSQVFVPALDPVDHDTQPTIETVGLNFELPFGMRLLFGAEEGIRVVAGRLRITLTMGFFWAFKWNLLIGYAVVNFRTSKTRVAQNYLDGLPTLHPSN